MGVCWLSEIVNMYVNMRFMGSVVGAIWIRDEERECGVVGVRFDLVVVRLGMCLCVFEVCEGVGVCVFVVWGVSMDIEDTGEGEV